MSVPSVQARLRNRLLFTSGLAVGAANTVRHRLRGYDHPRPFGTEDADRVLNYARGVIDRLERVGSVSWQGLDVLEIGPGNDLSAGAVVLSRGAASYTAVDAFDNVQDVKPVREALGVDESQLNLTIATFPGLPELSGQYDVIFSHATLEHIEDVPRLFARLRELVAPDGRMVHFVDALTHMRGFRERDPLNVLRYPDWLYRSVLDFPGAPNRLRLDDYRQAATRAGWAIRQVEVGSRASDAYINSVRGSLSSRWSGREDLDALMFVISCDVLARPSNTGHA